MNHPTALRIAVLLLGTSVLAGCMSNDPPSFQANAPTPLDHYPMSTETRTDALHFKIHAGSGLSDNQRRALDQVALKATWNGGGPVDIGIVTASTPDAQRTGDAIRLYLEAHQVSTHSISASTSQAQPADVVSLITHEYRAVVPQCNLDWENIAATRHNVAPQNMGCAVNANLAAQIDDPRDIHSPEPYIPGDAGRRTIIIDKYRKGEVTSAAKDEAAKSNIAKVIQ
ncbi:CpaD family pilus assembly protein [Asticcacaulis sp. AND118]|uniref:CpaD family pilus assembly protein n=1 Tax=Asticcacaulis sp. AND118 TaxID=2840468 RepID=UPI001D001274|nr:CpaD family pilus assembly protein [Asticcacaulis sp. AND118]UDF03747.1 CpaD family pilus assembly protein [Asticcacaulis sp. AND118]